MTVLAGSERMCFRGRRKKKKKKKNLRPYLTYKIEIKIPNMESSLMKSMNPDKEFSTVIRKE